MTTRCFSKSLKFVIRCCFNGLILKREEAIALLREVIRACDGIDEQAIILVPANINDLLSHGYQLQVKAPMGDNMTCIREIITKHGLAVSNDPEKNLIIIY